MVNCTGNQEAVSLVTLCTGIQLAEFKFEFAVNLSFSVSYTFPVELLSYKLQVSSTGRDP